MIRLLLILTIGLSGCCTTYYRYDGKEYYRVDECPDGTKTVKCTSKQRLPNSECY